MPNDFNANDVFEMAIQIEKNGAAFYRNAAEQTEGKAHKDFLIELAVMEDAHEKTFAAMLGDLKGNENFANTFDPEDENILYIKALADTRVFFEKDQPDNSLKGILSSAIQAEKDSITFYLGMKEMIPEKMGQGKIDYIIKEEMKHIRLLAGKLAEFF